MKKTTPAALGIVGGFLAVGAAFFWMALAAFAGFDDRVPTSAEWIAVFAVWPGSLSSLLEVLGGFAVLARPRVGGKIMLFSGIVGLVAVGIPFIALVIEALLVNVELGWFVPMGIFLVAQVLVVEGGRLAGQVPQEVAMAADKGQSPTMQAPVGWRLWGLWVLGTTASGLLFGSPWLWLPGLGVVQWMVLRRYLPHSRGWVLTYALGWLVGIAVGSVLLVMSGTAPGEPFESVIILVTAPFLPVTIAALQWRILRRYVSRAGWWVPASAASWYLTIGMNRLGTWAVGDVTLLGELFGPAVFGATTGAVLVWLLRQPLGAPREEAGH